MIYNSEGDASVLVSKVDKSVASSYEFHVFTTGTLKMRERRMQDRKMRHHMWRNCKGGKRGTIKCGTRTAVAENAKRENGDETK